MTTMYTWTRPVSFSTADFSPSTRQQRARGGGSLNPNPNPNRGGGSPLSRSGGGAQSPGSLGGSKGASGGARGSPSRASAGGRSAAGIVGPVWAVVAPPLLRRVIVKMDLADVPAAGNRDSNPSRAPYHTLAPNMRRSRANRATHMVDTLATLKSSSYLYEHLGYWVAALYSLSTRRWHHVKLYAYQFTNSKALSVQSTGGVVAMGVVEPEDDAYDFLSAAQASASALSGDGTGTDKKARSGKQAEAAYVDAHTGASVDKQGLPVADDDTRIRFRKVDGVGIVGEAYLPVGVYVSGIDGSIVTLSGCSALAGLANTPLLSSKPVVITVGSDLQGAEQLCRCHSRSVRAAAWALQSALPLVRFRRALPWLGFRLSTRILLRKLIRRIRATVQARRATQLQAWCRRIQAENRLQAARRGAVRLQALHRGNATRRRQAVTHDTRSLQYTACVKIQSTYRRHAVARIVWLQRKMISQKHVGALGLLSFAINRKVSSNPTLYSRTLRKPLPPTLTLTLTQP